MTTDRANRPSPRPGVPRGTVGAVLYDALLADDRIVPMIVGMPNVR